MRTIAKALLCLFAAFLLGSAHGQELMPDALVKNVTLEVVELIAKDKEIRGNRNKLIGLIDDSMEKTSAGWKVYDVMVGGVSLVANYRTEFNNTVRDSGIEGLIKTLSAKNRTLEAAGTAPQK